MSIAKVLVTSLFTLLLAFKKDVVHNFAVSKFPRNFANVYHFNAVDALLHLRFRRATRLHALQKGLRCCCTHVMHYMWEKVTDM